MRGTSEVLQRVFRQRGVNTYRRPFNSLRQQLTHVKDKTHTLKKCGVVYHVQCDKCPADYIGETARPLDTRLKEHQSRSNSAIYEHCDNTGHCITPDTTKVLVSEDHQMKRKVREAIEIKRRQPTLNRDGGLELPPVYNAILPSLDLSLIHI